MTVHYLGIYSSGSFKLRHFCIQGIDKLQNFWCANKPHKPGIHVTLVINHITLHFHSFSGTNRKDNYLSRVPFVNHVSELLPLLTSSLKDWTANATCSSATFKWATNGFNNPDASFSVFPSLETNNSHLSKQFTIINERNQ